MIEKILERLEETDINDIQMVVSETLVKYGFPRESVVQDEIWDALDGLSTNKFAIKIVQEVAKEYDAFDVIYKKVCELEKRYDEDADVGNVNGCIRLENLLQCFKEELKAPYQKAPSRCDTCTHNVADEVPPICYMCSKGIEDNYERKGE